MPSHAGYVMDTHCKDMDSVSIGRPTVSFTIFERNNLTFSCTYNHPLCMRLFYGWSRIILGSTVTLHWKMVEVEGVHYYAQPSEIEYYGMHERSRRYINVYLLSYSLYSCTGSLSLSTFSTFFESTIHTKQWKIG